MNSIFKVKIWIQISVLILLNALIFIITGNTEPEFRFQIIRLFFILIVLVYATFIFAKYILPASAKESIKSVSLSLFVVFVMFWILEAVFMFIPRSHEVGYSLAGKLWFNKHKRPINSFGFRDQEPEKEKVSVFFIGDSFTWGHGLDYNDRVSDLVQQQVKQIQCINLGMNGADTRKETQILSDFMLKSGLKPKHVVWQYFGNDIDRLAIDSLKTETGFKPYNNLSDWQKSIVKGSFLINYIYWLFPHTDGNQYESFLTSAYSNQSVFKMHLMDIEKSIELIQSSGAKLTVLIIPFLKNPEFSRELYMERIDSFYRSKNINTIRVDYLIEDLNPGERVVNKNDGHSSARVNQRIADKLLPFLKPLQTN